MLRYLTPTQRSLIREYMKDAKAIYFHGIDQNELPVVSFTDDRRTSEPFAILKRTSFATRRKYSVTTEPAYPLRWFSEEELDFIEPLDHELLTSLSRPKLEGSNSEGATR